MLARRVQYFSESVIREMTRLANQVGAINLGQGMPDFEAPQEVKDAACRAIQDGFNQYAITWGAPVLRKAIAAKAKAFNGIDCDPDANITVCCGATECMMATMLALADAGDEVIIFQPFYENYAPDALLSGATPVWVPLYPPHWHFDPDELCRAFTPRTKAIILNTPNNPTGKVFSREELETIAQLCRKWDVVALSDEIYEHILYDGATHVPIATLPGMADRTVTINALSKTYSVTGWRVGWTIASPELTGAIRKVHDFLTVGAAAPLQEAGAAALALPDAYYARLAEEYRARRDLLLEGLRGVGFRCEAPRGAYYILADAASLGCRDDVAFARKLVEDAGVGPVPGSSFFSRPELGRTLVRFAFPKREETLREAVSRLGRALAH
jgi:aminotransferase